MAESNENLSGDEREQRIAALKAKMQASAQQRQAEVAAEEGDATAAETEAPTAEQSTAAEESAVESEPADEATATPSDTDEANEAAAEDEAEDVAATNGASPAPATNGASAVAAESPAAPEMVGRVEEEEDEAAAEQRYYNRREFMAYAWGAATLLLAAQGGYVVYEFMYPRFRAGEFGGLFFVENSALPSSDAAPEAYTDGKFWLVQTEEGDPKALYMVCTHLGCLYKWEPANWRFECPCHGSKFTHDGFYIEGPAPRSLDYFDLETGDDGQLAVNTGRKINGDPAADSPARVVPA